MVKLSDNHLLLEVSIGTLCFQWNNEGRVTKIKLSGPRYKQPRKLLFANQAIPRPLLHSLDGYLGYFDRGEPFGEVPWEIFNEEGLTDFQKQVYRATAQIPHGETRNYAWVAEKVGKPLACRAVGQALKKNPFLVVVPCHRVVSTHDMGGFMGKTGELSPEVIMKRQLIELEESFQNPIFPFLNRSWETLEYRVGREQA